MDVGISNRARIETRLEQVEREDLVMFINASFACTRQHEFYGDSAGQHISIEFLHAYTLGNYRRLYSRTLAAGINHFNQARIVCNLLAAGSPRFKGMRAEEGELIAAALKRLPPNRVFQVFRELRQRRVNNRRTRAVIRRYLENQKDPSFHAVKYRSKVRDAVAHAHLKLENEIGRFLFCARGNQRFENELFEKFRQAHYSQAAVYDLPYTVAEGLAAKHRIPRDEFLAGIRGRMTAGEKFRMQSASQSSEVDMDIELGRLGLTRLAIYLLSLPVEVRKERQDELHDGLNRSAARALQRSPAKLGKVAAVLDASFSSSGSTEKHRRPLAIALGSSYLLRNAAREYRAFWSPAVEQEILVQAGSQTALGEPLLNALDWNPDLVVIVSDGFENDPPQGAGEVARIFRKKIDPESTTQIVHINPVFDADNFEPRNLGAAMPTVGVRDAEDLPTMLGFARFATGGAPLEELEDYLYERVRDFLAGAYE